MKNLVLIILLLFHLIRFSSAQPAGTRTFQTVNGENPSTAFSAPGVILKNQSEILQVSEPLPAGAILEWLDVDADQDMDFLSFTGDAGGFGPYQVTLYENVNQSFTVVSNSGLNLVATAYYITDVNQDNRMDFMFIENKLIKVARNNGDKTFVIDNTGIQLDWNGAPPLYCIDVDGDSDLDIVTRPHPDYYAFIPNVRYGSGTAVSYPPHFSFLSFANLDNADALDFFMTSFGEGYSVQANGIASGAIYPVGSSFLNATHPRVIWADVDLDGDLDLFSLTGFGWRVYKNLYAQTAQVRFEQALTFSGSTLSAAVGDLNSDGKPDFVVFEGNSIAVYINQSTSGGFQFSLDHSISGVAYSQIYLVDLDAQAGLDIVTNGTVFKNVLTSLSAPPEAPTGLVCKFEVGSLRMSWEDSHPGYQYRFEVYKNNQLIVSCGSADNGSLLRIQRTPILLGSHVSLGRWPTGQYSFRVQSVDASFRSSPFSELKEMEVDVPVGLPESVSFSVYPNPASERFSVMLPSPGSLIIRDNLSRVLFQRSFDEKGSQTIDVLSHAWAEGIYTIQFDNGSKRSIQKLIVIR
jgi:hypothetical protein